MAAKPTLKPHPLEDRLRSAMIAERRRRGITQDQLAAKMGYPWQGAVGKVECKACPLNLRFLLHYADSLGVAVEDLIAAARGMP